MFIDVFDDGVEKLKDIKWLLQVLFILMLLNQSLLLSPSQTIKSHHNAGWANYVKLNIVEPLNMLFKDEVRRIGKSMGIDSDILSSIHFQVQD